LHEIVPQLNRGYDPAMSSSLIRSLIAPLAIAAVPAIALAQNPVNSASQTPANLTAGQIVQQVERHNKARLDELRQYKALRHYAVEYKGFAHTVDAKMDVEVSYDAATGKNFRIVSQSGSNLLCDKVLKRAVDSEKEASQNKSMTALNETNYRFALLGTETVDGRPAYILHLEPLSEGKFLSRGKVWIDAEDFAVVKMETEPAKNPSFWISRTSISSSSVKTDGFWLPGTTRSETKVRIGGTAVLTIDYGAYQVVPAETARLTSY
jgi:outer membrane lipoprotein-sorting protein